MQTTSLTDEQPLQKVIITGASSGVGFEAAIELAIKGHEVIALARSQEKLTNLHQIVYSLNPEAKFFPIVFDIVNDEYAGLVQFIQQRWGKFNILINNAGSLISKPFKETTEFDMIEMFQSNVLGHFRITQELLPFIEKQGHILNIGSMGGYMGSAKFPGLIAYSASKAALHNFTECLAQELTDEGIKVNCLALGSAQTEMLEKAFPGYQSPVQAFEMGKYIADFAITGAKFFNGKIIPVAVTTP
ncbi:short-chain dehydrogenase/reductase SDR [Pseudopedobacter saltans DSM 12145]|uniref:Short-chain dehydrogenase/reductase SDR n=1 Tax=Pseudopedobacter saltans (strain ATCC 51119 / DSM 12145 / JCM 21818 / CCUG 39354 / LMG 10337 / NBRC 100064 / NCIMB 13643) TaxID=762903 RepID=F0SDL5_PSESL|nr:SDR family oxidoreductase [Pseudopedobacter saltans]ADY50742.1 short-chain dehydrogenase/reductase SDR [Pseudopedobacter saltans DSM 12145]